MKNHAFYVWVSFSLFYKAFRLVRVSQIKNSLSRAFTRTSYNEFLYFSSSYAILVPKYYKSGFREEDGLYFIEEKKFIELRKDYPVFIN